MGSYAHPIRRGWQTEPSTRPADLPAPFAARRPVSNTRFPTTFLEIPRSPPRTGSLINPWGLSRRHRQDGPARRQRPRCSAEAVVQEAAPAEDQEEVSLTLRNTCRTSAENQRRPRPLQNDTSLLPLRTQVEGRYQTRPRPWPHAECCTGGVQRAPSRP